MDFLATSVVLCALVTGGGNPTDDNMSAVRPSWDHYGGSKGDSSRRVAKKREEEPLCRDAPRS